MGREGGPWLYCLPCFRGSSEPEGDCTMGNNTRRHVPGRPTSADPPQRLVEIASAVVHPDVTRTGLTTTKAGEWALFVRLRRGARTPVPEIAALAAGYPIVYEDEPADYPVARPAYPDRGE